MTYEERIREYALANENVVVMTAENRALIRNLPPILGPRLIDTGITEQTMIGAAAGLALRGRKPIVHALGAFLTMRAFEFVRTDVGIPGLPVKMSSFVPGFLSDGNGPTHQAIEDIALMRGIPGMQVFSPADNEDMLLMLNTIWDSPQPTYMRVNTRPSVVQHQPFEMGKAEVLFPGTDVALLCHGMLLEQVVEARNMLQQHGLSVSILNMRSLVPFDTDAVLDLARKGTPMVSIEDHFQTGGLYSILAETFLDAGMAAKVLPIALNQKWFKPGLLSEVLRHEGFSPEQLAGRVLDFLGIQASKELKDRVSKIQENSFDE
jgi:transketolase